MKAPNHEFAGCAPHAFALTGKQTTQVPARRIMKTPIDPRAPLHSFPGPVIALAFALSHVAALAQSDNLLPSGSFETVEDVKPWVSLYNAVPETEECAEGSQSMRITAYGWLLSPEMVEIDPVASYRLRAMVKLPETTLNPTRATEVTYALGLEMYDAQGRLIPNHGVVPIPGTETELLDAAEAGGIEVRVKGEWKRIEMGGIDYDGIAFGAESDFSDIPNPESYLIKSVEPGEGFTTITLARPLESAHSAGTRVRQQGHRDIIAARGLASDHWTEVILDIAGVSLPGQVSDVQFWPGTHSVRAAISAHSKDPDAPAEMLVDEVSLARQ